jgi:hypothetical protein
MQSPLHDGVTRRVSRVPKDPIRSSSWTWQSWLGACAERLPKPIPHPRTSEWPRCGQESAGGGKGGEYGERSCGRSLRHLRPGCPTAKGLWVTPRAAPNLVSDRRIGSQEPGPSAVAATHPEALLPNGSGVGTPREVAVDRVQDLLAGNVCCFPCLARTPFVRRASRGRRTVCVPYLHVSAPRLTNMGTNAGSPSRPAPRVS